MSDYLKSTVDFMKRHKKKLITLAVVSGAGVMGYYYAKRMVQKGMKQFEEMSKEMQQQMLEQQQREDELKRINQECANMVLTFIPPLKGAIKQCTDPKPVTEKLKSFRQRQVKENTPESEEMEKLWDELKVISVSRLISSVYALCILNALLRVQLHVLARIAFNEQLEARKRSAKKGSTDEAEQYETKITRQVRERFLFAASDHLINSGEGMEHLVNRIAAAIRHCTQDWLMGTDATISRSELLDKVHEIRAAIERKDGSESVRAWLTRCIIPEDESQVINDDRELSEEQNGLLRDMLNETMDMVESPIFTQAVEESLVCTFSVLTRDLQFRSFAAVSKTKSTAEAGAASDSPKPAASAGAKGVVEIMEEPSEERFMLTKLIVTLLKQVATDVFNVDGQSNAYTSSLNSISAAEELCQAIFNQGVEISNPLDALGDMGFGGEDMQALTKLLSGLAGGGEGDDMDLMKLLGGDGQELMNLLAGGDVGQGQGNLPQDADIMQLLSGMMNDPSASAQGQVPSQAPGQTQGQSQTQGGQGRQTTNADLERMFGR